MDTELKSSCQYGPKISPKKGRVEWNWRLDTFGNCQRPVLVYPYAQHNKSKLRLKWSSQLQENNKRKNTLFCATLCAFRCIIKYFSWKCFINWVRNYLFLKKKLRYLKGSRFSVPLKDKAWNNMDATIAMASVAPPWPLPWCPFKGPP